VSVIGLCGELFPSLTSRAVSFYGLRSSNRELKEPDLRPCPRSIFMKHMWGDGGESQPTLRGSHAPLSGGPNQRARLVHMVFTDAQP
jgi:hypothetical protein